MVIDCRLSRLQRVLHSMRNFRAETIIDPETILRPRITESSSEAEFWLQKITKWDVVADAHLRRAYGRAGNLIAIFYCVQIWSEGDRIALSLPRFRFCGDGDSFYGGGTSSVEYVA